MSLFKKSLISLLLLLVLCDSVWAFKSFDISNVSYDIESRLDEKEKSLRGSEIISFKTGERTYTELYFYIHQNSHPLFFSLDSAFVNKRCAKFIIPDIGDKEILKIPIGETLTPYTSVEVKLYFSLRFGNDLDEFNAAYWKGDFYCADCYPKLAEFDWEGAILPDSNAKIPPLEKNKNSTCGTTSYLEETYQRMADYKLKITLPAKFKIIANGECNDTLINLDGTKTHIYEAKAFPGVVWIATTSRELLVAKHEDLTAYCYYQQNNRNLAEETINKINIIEGYYSEKFGPYPRPKLKIVLLDLPSFLGGASGNDILLLPSGDGLLDQILGSKMVLSHEVSHQWWGGAIACGTGPEGWFAEALASYSAELFCSDHKECCPDKSLLGNFNDKSSLWLYIMTARADQDKSLRGAGVG